MGFDSKGSRSTSPCLRKRLDPASGTSLLPSVLTQLLLPLFQAGKWGSGPAPSVTSPPWQPLTPFPITCCPQSSGEVGTWAEQSHSSPSPPLQFKCKHVGSSGESGLPRGQNRLNSPRGGCCASWLPTGLPSTSASVRCSKSNDPYAQDWGRPASRQTPTSLGSHFSLAGNSPRCSSEGSVLRSPQMLLVQHSPKLSSLPGPVLLSLMLLCLQILPESMEEQTHKAGIAAQKSESQTFLHASAKRTYLLFVIVVSCPIVFFSP